MLSVRVPTDCAYMSYGAFLVVTNVIRIPIPMSCNTQYSIRSRHLAKMVIDYESRGYCRN
jgi:hypothetical protein